MGSACAAGGGGAASSAVVRGSGGGGVSPRCPVKAKGEAWAGGALVPQQLALGKSSWAAAAAAGGAGADSAVYREWEGLWGKRREGWRSGVCV